MASSTPALADKIGRAIQLVTAAGELTAPAAVAEPNRLIDHTLLKPTAGPDQVRQLCAEAGVRFCDRLR